MNKRCSGNPFKIVLFCMCLAVFFGVGVQVAFAAETTGGQAVRQLEETQHGRSVQLGNDQRQRARQITDRQQEIARRIAEREEARTRQMEK